MFDLTKICIMLAVKRNVYMHLSVIEVYLLNLSQTKGPESTCNGP